MFFFFFFSPGLIFLLSLLTLFFSFPVKFLL
uniref:Uncharacterized protein n=1 Tax=Anguilla anguilla TaxID=7936 RepID=A0A0E9XZY5_ANGAN